jgi:hypothetical protein
MVGVLAVVVLIALIQPIFDEVLGGESGCRTAQARGPGRSSRQVGLVARCAAGSTTPARVEPAADDVSAILLLGVLTLFFKNA